MVVDGPLPGSAQPHETSLLSHLIFPVHKSKPFTMHSLNRPGLDLSGRSRSLERLHRSCESAPLLCPGPLPEDALPAGAPEAVGGTVPGSCLRSTMPAERRSVAERPACCSAVGVVPRSRTACASCHAASPRTRSIADWVEIGEQQFFGHGRREAFGSDRHSRIIQSQAGADHILKQGERIALRRERRQFRGAGLAALLERPENDRPASTAPETRAHRPYHRSTHKNGRERQDTDDD